MSTIAQFQTALAKAERKNGYVSINQDGNVVVKGTGFGKIALWFRTEADKKANDTRVMQSFVRSLKVNYGENILKESSFNKLAQKSLSTSLLLKTVDKATYNIDTLKANQAVNESKIQIATAITNNNSLLHEKFNNLAQRVKLPITFEQLLSYPAEKSNVNGLIENIKKELLRATQNPHKVLSSDELHDICNKLVKQYLTSSEIKKLIYEVKIADKKLHSLNQFADNLSVDATQKAEVVNRLEKIQKRREMLINQPITVNDIHARSAYEKLTSGVNNANLGEFAYVNAPAGDTVKRINQHIDNLAHTANAWHEQNNFIDANGTKVMKDEAKNNITRLCTDEFAFWPKSGPLKKDDFLKIISHIEETAQQQQKNLTLILASFPVEGADGKVHNTVVHVQCGENPVINVFAKTTMSDIDPDYSKQDPSIVKAPTAAIYEPASQDEYDRGVPSYFYDKEKKAPALMPFMDNNGNGFVISRDNVVHVKTAGGAQCFDVVDICLDHDAGTGERNLTAELNERAKNLGLDLMPNQVSQVISSASIQKSSGPNVSSIILHADPHKGAVREDQSEIKRPLRSKELAPFNAIFGDKNTEIKSGQLRVKNTHFGPPLEIEFYKPYSLDKATKRVDKALLQSA